MTLAPTIPPVLPQQPTSPMSPLSPSASHRLPEFMAVVASHLWKQDHNHGLSPQVAIVRLSFTSDKNGSILTLISVQTMGFTSESQREFVDACPELRSHEGFSARQSSRRAFPAA